MDVWKWRDGETMNINATEPTLVEVVATAEVALETLPTTTVDPPEPEPVTFNTPFTSVWR